MSMTEHVDVDGTTRVSAGEPEARRLRREFFDDEVLDKLIGASGERGVALTGEGGFLPEMIKAVLERGMKAELTDHLGYQAGDAAGRGSGNSRNGTTPKTIATEIGEVRLDQPRDRNSTFASALVPKGARRLGGLEDMIISLYAGGMTIRDIQHHLAATLGTELSHESISNVTDAVLEEITAWQSRPVEAFYPVIFMDALVVKVRDGAHVANRAAHIAVGVDLDGVKHVLGIWVQATEGAKFWAGVCAQLANRGLRDVLIVCCDGLTGFGEAPPERAQPPGMVPLRRSMSPGSSRPRSITSTPALAIPTCIRMWSSATRPRPPSTASGAHSTEGQCTPPSSPSPSCTKPCSPTT